MPTLNLATALVSDFYIESSPFLKLRSVEYSFPNLDSQSLNLAALFSPISVEVLNIWASGQRTWTATPDSVRLIEYINEMGPQLRSLKIDTDFGIASPFDNFPKLNYETFTKLVQLRVKTNLQQNLLARIAHLPLLESLTIEDEQTYGISPLQWPQAGFTLLRSFSLFEVQDSHVHGLLQRSSGNVPPSVSQIQVPTFFGGEMDLTELYRDLAMDIASGGWSYLTTLDILLLCDEDSGQFPITWESVKPLLSIPTLESLKFQHEGGVSISPENVTEALGTWRRVRCLHIRFAHYDGATTFYESSPVSKLCIDVLDVFADLCPRIEDIGLTFNNALPRTRDLERPRLRSLRNLDVTGSLPIDRLDSLLYLSSRIEKLSSVMWNDINILEETPIEGRYGWEYGGLDLTKWHSKIRQLPALMYQRDEMEWRARRR